VGRVVEGSVVEESVEGRGRDVLRREEAAKGVGSEGAR